MGRRCATVALSLALLLSTGAAGAQPDARALTDARALFAAARGAPPGRERDALWKKAAESYRAWLDRHPDDDDAAEGAINAAYAYKQVGAYGEATAVYRRLLDGYGSERALTLLRRGNPRRYEERRRHAQAAVTALAGGLMATLDLAGVTALFDAAAAGTHYEPGFRRDAAYNALLLHARAGEREAALAARRALSKLDPPPSMLVEADWIVAHAAIAAWDARLPDAGGNRAARLAALAEVERFVTQHERRAEAARWVFDAARAAARLHRAGGDPAATAWCERAARALDRWKAGAPGDPRSIPADASLAEECAPAPRGHRGTTAADADILPPPLPAPG